MKITVTDPSTGRVYWWINVACKEPEILTVKKVSKKNKTIEFEVFNPYKPANPGSVTWTFLEWEAAQKQLCDYHPPVKKEDLAEDEELCRICNGDRWERTRDSDTLPCMWCGMDGKQKKTPPVAPTHTQRSPLHPKVPIRE